MKIKHFLYNAFIIENGKVKIAIDPGQNLWIYKLGSLIPKAEWKDITHVLVTHGDPDHYWQADRVASTADAPLIVRNTMVKKAGEEIQILGPRSRGVQFIPYAGRVFPLEAKETIEIDGVNIRGINTTHGPIEFKILGMKQQVTPGPEERVGFGSMGFKIQTNNKIIINLGDTLFKKEWTGLKPDVLMIPIGGLGNKIWTMDVAEALEAVRLISPKLVIPCHYNVPFFFKKKFAPADDQYFKREAEKLGIECTIMNKNDEIEI